MISTGKLKNRRRGVWLLFILFSLGLACLVCAEAAESRASDGRYVATDWARRYKGPAGGDDTAVAIGVDGQGNIYVTGSSMSGAFGYDIITIKYSPEGGRLWARRYHSPENYSSYATAIAVDSQGNVHVAGYSLIESHRNEDSTIFVTLKYDTNGKLLWERHFDGPVSQDIPTAMALDAQGNVYVTGESFGGATSMDYATIKYSPDGQELWGRRYNGPGNNVDYPTSLAVDAQGNVYVTGISEGDGTGSDFATIKYSPEGEELWVRRYNGPGNENDLAFAIAVDLQGNIHVTGASWGLDTGYDYATIKYSPEGQRLWVRRYKGPGEDMANAVAVDAQGNVFVTGYSTGFGTDLDYATIKYSPAGKRLWVRRYNGPGNSWDEPRAMTLDIQGNAFVTGISVGINTSFDFATVKYGPEGRRLWVRRYPGTGNGYDSPRGLAVDGIGNVFVTGESLGSGTGYDYLTIRYTQTP